MITIQLTMYSEFLDYSEVWYNMIWWLYLIIHTPVPPKCTMPVVLVCTVMDRPMNHPKWKINVTHVVFYFGLYFLISFTDIYPKSTPQNFQNKLWAFTWAGCQTALTATLEPKLANETLAKNGSKCGLFWPFLPFFIIFWHALACWGYVKKATSTLAQCRRREHRSKFVGDMHSHMSQLGRAAKGAK